LIDEFARGVKADHMVALLEGNAGEDFIGVGKELESTVAFSVVFLVAFKHAQQSAFSTTAVAEQQKPDFEFDALLLSLSDHELNNEAAYAL
jgi:hypothetical protein